MKAYLEVQPMTVSCRRRVTIDRELLDHLNVKPGDQLEVDLLPRGRCVLRAARTGSIQEFIGCLADKPRKTLGPVSVEELNEAIERAWAGEP